MANYFHVYSQHNRSIIYYYLVSILTNSLLYVSIDKISVPYGHLSIVLPNKK